MINGFGFERRYVKIKVKQVKNDWRKSDLLVQKNVDLINSSFYFYEAHRI